MKQRLLSFVAVAATSFAAMAQTWTAPVKPEAPVSPGMELVSSGEDVEAGSTYFVMNVGTGQFMIGANDWATEVSLSTNAKPYMQVQIGEISAGETVNGTKGTANTAAGDGYTMRLNGEFRFTGTHDRSNYAVSNSYIWRNGSNGYIDLNNQNKGFVWNFTKTDNGYYYIQVISEDTNFPSAASEYAGGVSGAGTGGGKPVKFDCSIEDDNIEWVFIPVESYNEEEYQQKVDDYSGKLEAYNTAVAIYDARVILYEMLNDAARFGADYSAASTVYNNNDATADELTAAAAALKPLVAEVILPYAKKNSTVESPVELTKYILVNPDFNDGTINGWTVTQGIGQNQGYQDNQVYENKEAGIDISKFIEAWRPAPNVLNDGQIYQTLNGLPSGHYILECDGVARNQTDISKEGYVDPEDYRGIYLFYNDGSITVHSETTLRDVEVETEQGTSRLPSHFKFEFDIDDVESVNIGLMAENTNLNWMAADNFKLSMAGPSQVLPSYTALRTEVANVTTMLANDIVAQKSLESALNTAYNTAKALVDAACDNGKDAEYKTAYSQLIEARNAVNTSIAAYARIESFLELLAADIEKYSEMANYEAMVSKIETLETKYNDAETDGILSAEEINADIDGYANMKASTVREIFDTLIAAGEPCEPFDITALFDNMTFPSAEAKNLTGGYPADAPVWMNETGTGNFKVSNYTAEVWNDKPFNIYREFANMPKGKYTIKTHAFYRVAANDTNYPAYMAGEYEGEEYAYIYAGSNHTHIINNAELTTTTKVVDGNDYETSDGTFIINGQAGAHKLFTDENFAEQADKAYISVSASVLEDGGTLRAGFAGTNLLQGNQWTVIDGFELYYEGVQGLDDEIDALLARLNALDQSAVVATNTLVRDAVAAGTAAKGQDLDVQAAAVQKMQAALEAYDTSEALVSKLDEVRQSYEDKKSDPNLEGTFTDETLDNIINEILNAYNSDKIESNEQIQGWFDALPKAWFAYIMSMVEMDDATEEEPVLVPIIENPSFTTGNKDGWTVVQEGDNGGTSDGCSEFWNATSFDMYQEFPTLKEGYWRLSANALYRYGNTDTDINALTDGTYKNCEYLYVNNIAVKVMDWHSTEGGAILSTGEEGEEAPVSTNKYNVTPTDGEPYSFWTTNGRAVFSKMINEYTDPETGEIAPRYLNTITFSYGVENGLTGAVRIGLKKAEKLVNYEWCPFSNFKLEYLGTTAPTAVEGLAAETPARAAIGAIYTMDGRQQSQIRRGVNIVRRADGSVSKVLVK